MEEEKATQTLFSNAPQGIRSHFHAQKPTLQANSS